MGLKKYRYIKNVVSKMIFSHALLCKDCHLSFVEWFGGANFVDTKEERQLGL